ncbi:sensor histidine kinase [Deinococcus gobiensis]|uniref:histidine kinase n=1 Tax=Deinococcus gobiensis (strain DSM 21396 / JCM 16679 / CGMCC 1.7299 / I-0) TaxID=745776 RepID=H8H1H6_DEIGI|nr:ATP-binding protein [Deinococcus gobiensis]AFD27373.1 two-component sensor kinase protein [Deinococcus gobiensis I-0]
MNDVAQLEQRFAAQQQDLHVHQVELEQQNEVLRQTNMALEEARNRYADLFEFAPVGYVVCDKSGLIGQINVIGCTQLGAARGQLVGRHFALFVEADQRAELALFLERVFRGPGADGPPHLELRMLRQGGQRWDAQLECTLLRGEAAPLARMVLTDITALKEFQRSAEWHATQAQSLHEELQTFLRSVTHDLSAPQRQIEGFTALLSQHLQSIDHCVDQTSVRLLRNLSQAAVDLGALTTSLIDFYHSGQPTEPARPLNLNHLVETVFHELEPQRRGRQVVLTHDPLPSLLVDHRSMHMVLTKLLSNAVKFTGPRPVAHIHVGVQFSGEQVLLSIRDNGVGFDPKQEQRLFRVFERLHSERDFPGQGLGLALVRRIVEHWQGQVWGEEVAGEGAVFWVQVPGAMNAAQHVTPDQSPAE